MGVAEEVKIKKCIYELNSIIYDAKSEGGAIDSYYMERLENLSEKLKELGDNK